MMEIAGFWLQAGGSASPPPPGNPWFSTLMFLVLMILIFYFFLIRPQVKRNRELRRFLENARPGIRVVTQGGIHGEIVRVHEDTFVIRTAGKTELKIDRSAVSLELTRAHYPEDFQKTVEKKNKNSGS